MGKRTRIEEDQWYGIKDAKKRKQIQDRLAQRARRKYSLGLVVGWWELTGNPGERLSNLASLVSRSPVKRRPFQPTRWVPSRDPKAAAAFQSPNGTGYVVLSESPPTTSKSASLISSHHAKISQPIKNHTVYSALFHNGLILNLPCSSAALSRSPPAGPHVPESLRPIPLQLQQVHYEWIDRFPIPQLRHNMIRFSDIINTEDFMADLFTGRTFEIEPGRASWDTDAWNVTPEFREKWSYLF